MTYKKIKFDESFVMRAFEKEALKRNLIAPELKKEAVKKEDINLTPSNDLYENILKLCGGLRKAGFDKYADEVEKNFFNVKKADVDLYNFFKETGQDVIDSFHPEGSVKLTNMPEEHVVNTISDQHKHMLDVLLKKKANSLKNKQKISNAIASFVSPNTAAGFARQLLYFAPKTPTIGVGAAATTTAAITAALYEIYALINILSSDFQSFNSLIHELKKLLQESISFDVISEYANAPQYIVNAGSLNDNFSTFETLYSKYLKYPKQDAQEMEDYLSNLLSLRNIITELYTNMINIQYYIADIESTGSKGYFMGMLQSALPLGSEYKKLSIIENIIKSISDILGNANASKTQTVSKGDGRSVKNISIVKSGLYHKITEGVMNIIQKFSPENISNFFNKSKDQSKRVNDKTNDVRKNIKQLLDNLNKIKQEPKLLKLNEKVTKWVDDRIKFYENPQIKVFKKDNEDKKSEGEIIAELDSYNEKIRKSNETIQLINQQLKNLK